MRLIIITVLLMVLAGVSLAGLQAQTTSLASSSVPALAEASPAPPAAAAPEAESAGLTAKALTVFRIGPFPVTNSMLVTWIVAIGIILFARYATRKMKEVPGRRAEFLGMDGGEPP